MAGELQQRSVFLSPLVLCFIFLSLLLPTSAKWVQDTIKTKDNWAFMTRFCFLSEEGRFDYVFKYPKGYGIQQLLLYYDEPGQWDSVYQTDKDCKERLSVLSKANNQIIDLTNRNTGSRSAGCTVYTHDGEEYYNCTDKVSFRAARARWWYIGVARCGPAENDTYSGLQLDYSMHMMNGEFGDFLHYELSADEFYILPTDIAFLMAYVVLMVLSIICAVRLFDKQMLHTTYKMYMTAVFLWLFGLLLQCIAWGRYGQTGWEQGATEVTGRLFLAASTAVFLLMLLLMAKGYTITRGRMTQMSTVRLTIFFCLYVIINITLFVWEGVFFDEGLVLYFYESPPGYGLVAIRLVGWLWFTYAFAFTMKHHPNKKRFYIPFYVFYTLWFWAGPIVILVAIFHISKWTREKTVNGVEQLVALLGHVFFLVLTRPSAANNNFPFHLRTCQVRFSDDDDEPTETYSMSEESRRHLENIFVVQRNGVPTANPAHNGAITGSPPPTYTETTGGGYINGGYSGEGGGGLNNGYMRNGNGYNPALDETFTTQKIHQTPPQSTADATSSSLPPLRHGNALPPLATEPAVPSAPNLDHVTDAPPVYPALPPQSQSRLPSLPPLGNTGMRRNSTLPPIVPSSSSSSQPPQSQDE